MSSTPLYISMFRPSYTNNTFLSFKTVKLFKMAPQTSPPTPAGIDSYRCRVCRGVHALRKCQRFLRLTVEKRLRAVLINKYCPNCLAHEHSKGVCRSGARCRVCQRAHHTLLHLRTEDKRPSRPVERRSNPKKPTPSRPVERHSTPNQPTSSRSHQASASTRRSGKRRDSTHSMDCSPPPRTGTSSRHRSPSEARPRPTPDREGPYPTTWTTLVRHKSISLLPTTTIVLDSGVKEFTTRALLDPCCATSRINAAMATAFGLSVTRIGNDSVCTARLRSKASDFNREILLEAIPDLIYSSPARSIDPSQYDAFANIALADEQWHMPAPIKVVLGSDVYPHILLPGLLPHTGGTPVAQDTTFGWVLTGVCNI